MKESSDGGKEPMDTDAEQESKSCDQDNFLFTKESSEVQKFVKKYLPNHLI